MSKPTAWYDKSMGGFWLSEASIDQKSLGRGGIVPLYEKDYFEKQIQELRRQNLELKRVNEEQREQEKRLEVALLRHYQKGFDEGKDYADGEPYYIGPPMKCTVPPENWICTRAQGHPGPCAAYFKENK